MKIYKLKEICEYKDLTFEVELEYYFDDFLKTYYVDVHLGNKNLQTIKNKYQEIKLSLTKNHE